MLETLKSIAFVVVTVMIALILQARAGNLSPGEGNDTSDLSTTYEQVQDLR